MEPNLSNHLSQFFPVFAIAHHYSFDLAVSSVKSGSTCPHSDWVRDIQFSYATLHQPFLLPGVAMETLIELILEISVCSFTICSSLCVYTVNWWRANDNRGSNWVYVTMPSENVEACLWLWLFGIEGLNTMQCVNNTLRTRTHFMEYSWWNIICKWYAHDTSHYWRRRH